MPPNTRPPKIKPSWFQRARTWLARKVGGRPVSEAIDDNGYLLTDIDLLFGLKDLRAMVFSWWYRYERYRGGNQFTFLTDQRIRDVARLLERYNPIAQGILSALKMYSLGDKGMQLEVHHHYDQSNEAVDLATDYIEMFKDRHCWELQAEPEIFSRSIRDGEVVLRWYQDDDGVTYRYIEPEFIVPPDGSAEWTFGFHNVPGDVQSIDALNVMYTPDDARAGKGAQYQEEVPLRDFYHIKRGVDKVIKRGLSDFASTWLIVEEAMKVAKNMMKAETQRQGIIYITQHKQSAPADVNAFVASQQNYVERIGADLGLGYQNQPVQITEGVGEVHLSGEQELASAPSSEGTEKAIRAINNSVLLCCNRYHMPLYVAVGDMSSNNTLDLGAESPFGLYMRGEQKWFAEHQKAIFWKVLALGVERGDLPERILDEIELVLTPQNTFGRDPFKETDRLQKLQADKIISRRTRCKLEGFDADEEARLIREEQNETQQVEVKPAGESRAGVPYRSNGHVKNRRRGRDHL